jgi:hypothetical protein
MARNRFIIDKITNSIEDAATGKSHETIIIEITSDENKKVHKKDGWFFNWKKEFKESHHTIYKLTLANSRTIEGLISLEPIADQQFIEMHLIENAPHNYGAKKRFAGVAGNLVAFACKMSFDMGFEGFVAFRAKTDLIDHYSQTLGARLIYSNDRMAIFPESAKNLVNSYYKNYLHDG